MYFKRALLSSAIVAFSFSAEAVVQTITGNTTGAPTFARPNDNGSNAPSSVSGSALHRHEAHTITVMQGSTYRFETVSPTLFDTYLVLYQGAFNPGNPLQNAIEADDDGGAGLLSMITRPLTSGSYVIVVTGWSATAFGAYTLEIECLTNCFDLETLREELKIQAAAQGVVLSKAQSRSIIQNLENRFADQGSDISPLLGYGETIMPTAADIVAQRWAVWGDVSGSILDGDTGVDISGHQLRQHFGFDYALNNNVIVGLSFGLSQFNTDAGSAEFIDGNSYFVQPYIGVSANGWLATLQAGYTFTDYDAFDLNPSASDAMSAKGDRVTVSASLSRTIDFDSVFSLTPEVRAIYGHEVLSDIDGTSGSLADETSNFFFTSASVELAHTLISEAGFGKAYLRAGVEYVETNGDGSSAALSTEYHSESVSGSLAAGLQYNMVNGFNVSGEVKSGGLGSDIANYGANLRLGYSF